MCLLQGAPASASALGRDLFFMLSLLEMGGLTFGTISAMCPLGGGPHWGELWHHHKEDGLAGSQLRLFLEKKVA